MVDSELDLEWVREGICPSPGMESVIKRPILAYPVAPKTRPSYFPKYGKGTSTGPPSKAVTTPKAHKGK